MTVEADSQSQDPNIPINDLLSRDPSGPDFTQPTIKYCQDSIEFGLGKIGGVLKSQFPEDADLITSKLESAKSDSLPIYPSDLLVENGELYLRVPGGDKSMHANLIVQSICHANPQLVVFKHAIAFYLPPTSELGQRRRPIRQSPRRQVKESDRHLGFHQRFTNIVDTGQLPLASPIAEIIAVGYITQVAKISGFEEAKKLLKRGQSYGGLESRENLVKHLEDVVEQTHKIRKDQAFIEEGSRTINRIAEQNGMDKDKVQLLMDIAFIDDTAFNNDSQFMNAFRPIVRFIAERDWEEAFAHRDFLLKYFIISFPAWRQRTYQENTGLESFKSMEEVAYATRTGELVINEEDVPTTYQALGESIKRRVTRLEKKHELAIIGNSVGLSNRLLGSIARFEDEDGCYRVPTGVKEGFERVGRVQLRNDNQACDRPEKNSRNFGIVLYRYIRRAQNLDTLSRIVSEKEGLYSTDLRIDKFKRDLIQAYNFVRNVNPDLTFSQKEYLMALIHSGKGDISETDPVSEFIETIKN